MPSGLVQTFAAGSLAGGSSIDVKSGDLSAVQAIATARMAKRAGKPHVIKVVGSDAHGTQPC